MGERLGRSYKFAAVEENFLGLFIGLQYIPSVTSVSWLYRHQKLGEIIGHLCMTKIIYLLFNPLLFVHVVGTVQTVYNLPESPSGCIIRTAFDCNWIILRISWCVSPNIHNSSGKDKCYTFLTCACAIHESVEQ